MNAKIDDQQNSDNPTSEEQTSDGWRLTKINSWRTAWRSLLTKFFADENFLLYSKLNNEVHVIFEWRCHENIHGDKMVTKNNYLAAVLKTQTGSRFSLCKEHVRHDNVTGSIALVFFGSWWMESVLPPSWMFRKFLQLWHLVHRLFYALLIPCSSLFACPLVVSRLSCATLYPFGISFLPLWSLALRCLLFSLLSVKRLLMTSILMARLTWVLVIIMLYYKIMFLSFFLFPFFFHSFVHSFSPLSVKESPPIST